MINLGIGDMVQSLSVLADNIKNLMEDGLSNMKVRLISNKTQHGM